MWLMDEVPMPTRSTWDKVQGIKLLTQVYNMLAVKGEREFDSVMSQIPAFLNNLFQTNGIVMSKPEVDPAAPTKPATFLLTGMSEAVAKKMVSYRVFCTKKFQFFIYSYHQGFPSYMCTLEGFNPSALLGDRAENDVLKAIHETLTSAKHFDTVWGFTRTSQALNSLPPRQAVDKLARSIRVKIMREKAHADVDTPVVNIYCPSPTANPSIWSQWKLFLRSVPFQDPILGIGQHGKDRHCDRCHGHDHARGMCPFL